MSPRATANPTLGKRRHGKNPSTLPTRGTAGPGQLPAPPPLSRPRPMPAPAPSPIPFDLRSAEEADELLEALAARRFALEHNNAAGNAAGAELPARIALVDAMLARLKPRLG